MRDTLLGGSAGKITYYLGIHFSYYRAPLPCTCGDVDPVLKIDGEFRNRSWIKDKIISHSKMAPG